jgi:hypothetical protein
MSAWQQGETTTMSGRQYYVSPETPMPALSYSVIAAGRREFISLRRALASVVLIDGVLLWSMLLASLLQCYAGEDSLLFVGQLTHVVTVLLGCVSVVHARHAYGVLRLLFVFFLIGFVGDVIVLLVRVAMAYGVDTRLEPYRRRTQLVYAALAFLMALVDATGAYVADQIREKIATTLPFSSLSRHADMHNQQLLDSPTPQRQPQQQQADVGVPQQQQQMMQQQQIQQQQQAQQQQYQYQQPVPNLQMIRNGGSQQHGMLSLSRGSH